MSSQSSRALPGSASVQGHDSTESWATERLLGGECGKRLIAHIVDETARVTPDVECLSIPRSNDARDGWKPVSWAQISTAVDYVAHMLTKDNEAPAPGTIPTIGYIGWDDPRYPVFMIGAIKAGYKALFISPRNSLEAQLSLFEESKCNILYHEKQYTSMVEPWVNGRPGMRSVAVAPFDAWVSDTVEPFPYNKTFAEAQWDPLVVVHTSGSTGHPKIVMIPQGVAAGNDLHRTVPPHNGNPLWLPAACRFRNPRKLSIPPLFHAGGLMLVVICGFFYNAPVAYRPPCRPVTEDNVLEWLQHCGAGWVVIPPAILDPMSRSPAAIEVFKKMDAVGFGGGPIAPATPNRLVEHGIMPLHIIAATEFAFLPFCLQPDPTLWSWFIVPKDVGGFEWRKFNEDAYELVVVRKDQHPGLQACFYVFPQVDEYGMKDLYQPHPILPDHWTYIGRADDIIVFSTGEKLNPVTIEGVVMGHEGVLSAQVVGSKQFHATLLIEPVHFPSSESKKEQFLDDIWPIIDKVNEETVAHGRISRDFVFLSDPQRPFPRAGKGTIQRSLVTKLYEDDISQIYANSKGLPAISFDLDVTSEKAFANSMRELLHNVLKFRDLSADDDFFAAGVDSLEMIQLSRVLRASLEKIGLQIGNEALAPREIYTHPTVVQLTAYTYSLVRAQGTGNGQATNLPALVDTEDDANTCDALVAKYTIDLPAAVPNKPAPADENQVIIITGTTGSLGSYLLHFALASPNVSKVICLNRVADGRVRQQEVSSSRGLSTGFSRVEFLQADLAQPDLGLGATEYGRLAEEVDRIIHNGWPVNFNMSILSFEPHIRGVRHLVDFSGRAARKSVPITFISSVGSAQKWKGPGSLIPETSLPDWSIATMGYGKSKLASSMILDRASEVSGVPSTIIRVGQVAGPRGSGGKWNPQEWLPSLVRSSLYLGLLPDHLGTFDGLAWAPAEDIAQVVLEVSAVTSRLPLGQISGYFHALNPKPTDWSGLVPALCDFYGARIQKVVSLDEWVRALENSQAAIEDVENNPGVKLLSTYKAALEDAKQGKQARFATGKTESCSVTMREMKAVSPELLRHWCEQWQF
ncbi:hypothetical protein BX600DRAFT_384872 [Xylariales sp. PMI_506]|nr:hypothetical protein BX600DRAFT_384872 [Xylariales sp. PMI_506]